MLCQLDFMTERGDLVYVAQVLDQTDRHKDKVDLMKQIIGLNPVLNAEERNLLSGAYKELIAVHRKGLRTLSEYVMSEDLVLSDSRKAHIDTIFAKIIKERDAACYELIKLIDEILLPATQDAQGKIFYLKLKGDYYRYVCETKAPEEYADDAEDAKTAYIAALDMAKAELQPYVPIYLGLVLNYCVFLHEVYNNREEAITLANQTVSETTPLLENNSSGSYTEAAIIMQLLRDNIALWTGEV